MASFPSESEDSKPYKVRILFAGSLRFRFYPPISPRFSWRKWNSSVIRWWDSSAKLRKLVQSSNVLSQSRIVDNRSKNRTNLEPSEAAIKFYHHFSRTSISSSFSYILDLNLLTIFSIFIHLSLHLFFSSDKTQTWIINSQYFFTTLFKTLKRIHTIFLESQTTCFHRRKPRHVTNVEWTGLSGVGISLPRETTIENRTPPPRSCNVSHLPLSKYKTDKPISTRSIFISLLHNHLSTIALQSFT